MPMRLNEEEIQNLAAILQAEQRTPHDALTRAVGRPVDRAWDLGQLDTVTLVKLLTRVEQCTSCGRWTPTDDLLVEMPEDAICPYCA